jgi:hypothetical protein
LDLWANSRLKGGERVEREEREEERELLFDGPHTKLAPLAPLGGANVSRANLRLKGEG